MQNKRQVLLRPQRQSGHVDNLRFFTCIFWVGKKIAANGSWFKVGKKDLSDYWNCIFVLQCRISYLVGCVEGGERDHLYSSSWKHYSEASVRTTSHSQNTRTCATCYSCCSLPTETLVQKLLVYMKRFLITLESNIFSSWKFDGDNRLLTIFCLRVEVWTLSFLGWGRLVLLILLRRELRLYSSEQHAKTSYSPFPDPLLSSLIYGWIT